MENYTEYDLHEFSKDASFRRWVLNGSTVDAAFWIDWLQQHPERADVIEQARNFLVAVQAQYHSPITDEEVDEGVGQLMSKLPHADAVPELPIIPLNSRRVNWVRWSSVAAILLVGIGLAWQVTKSGRRPFATDPAQSTANQSPWLDRINTGDQPLSVMLTDGSVVTLEPGSRLRFPRRFVGKQRAVTLAGEAFFEVAHRPQQPFVVTTNDFTTTVLGTSFRIRTSSPSHRAFVIVRSGRVAVEPRVQAGVKQPSTISKPVILVRNEQVINPLQVSQPLVKTPVQNVQLVANDVNKEQVFDDVAVAAVFEALEKQYGVSIDYDKATLSRCFVNTAFEQENLRERLSAVCQAVGATYLITDTTIVISSNGCTL